MAAGEVAEAEQVQAAENHCLLQGIVEALPELLGTIQAQLLDLLSLVLAGRPYRDTIHPSHLAAYHAAVTHGMHPTDCGACLWNTGKATALTLMPLFC